jgi:hypothetical protein
MKPSFLGVVLVVLIAASSDARGAAFIVASQDNGNVVLTGYGTINLSALSKFADGIAGSAGFQGVRPAAEVGPNSTVVDLYRGESLIAPASIGTSTTFVPSDGGSGDFFGGSYFLGGMQPPGLIVPDGYATGTSLSGTSFFLGESFSTLGIAPGVYQWTWGVGADADSLTFQAVPEPSTAIYLVLLVAGYISIARQRLCLIGHSRR